MNKFYGTGVALVTPFDNNGQVDYPALKKLVTHLIDNGIDYLVSLGTTGESATLTKEEKKKIWAYTAEVNNARVPLVAGIASNNTIQVVEDIKAFNTAGYDAILSASPHYNKPNQQGIYYHYKAIAESAPLPIMLYNVPSRTGSNVTAETTVRLATDFKNIIGTKEASGNFEQLNQLMRDKPADFLVISGDDPISLQMIAMGAVGVISVIGNAVPKQFSDMIRLCLQAKFAEAQRGHYNLIEFTRLVFADGSPAGVKTALKSLDICGDTLRLPLYAVNGDIAAKIIAETKRIIG